MLLLLTVLGSMAPLKGTVMRGWVEKPSSVLSRSMSAQSLGRAVQSGLGSFTRRSVFCVKSNTVYRLLGKSAPATVVPSLRTVTPSAQAGSASTNKEAAKEAAKARACGRAG